MCRGRAFPVVGVTLIGIVGDARNGDGVKVLPPVLPLLELHGLFGSDIAGHCIGKHLHIRGAHVDNIRRFQRFFNIALQRGDQHRRQNPKYGQYDDQLHQRKATLILQFFPHSFRTLSCYMHTIPE